MITSTNREDIEHGRKLIEGGRAVRARDLKEGDEIVGVGVMEADAEPLGSTHVRLYVGGDVFDQRADSKLTIAA